MPSGPARLERSGRSNQMKPLGAFLRCTGLSDPEEALAAVKSIGLDTIQVSKLDDSFYTPEGARRFGAMMDAAGVSATSVVIVFDGESYRNWKAVEDTVGFRPAALLGPVHAAVE